MKRERKSGLSPGGIERRIRQNVNARAHTFFAIVQPGFEETALRELLALGAGDAHCITTGGIEFTAKMDGLYRTVISARTITRILLRLDRFPARRFDRLRVRIASFPWELYLKDGAVLKFRVACSASRLYHTTRIEEEIRHCILRRLKIFDMTVHDAGPERPENVQTLFVRINDDHCQVSLDATGLLYRRGSKCRISRAPLRETLASLILMEARAWEYDLILDPMCGSGSFSLEAAMILSGRPPGTRKDFPFMAWPSFRPATYEHLLASTARDSRSLPEWAEGRFPVLASDIDPEAVSITERNIRDAGFDGLVRVEQGDFFARRNDYRDYSRRLVVLNPPFGKRLKDPRDDTYRKIGLWLRRHADWGFAVLVPGLEMEKRLATRYDRKIPFIFGGLKVAALFRDGKCKT